MTSEQCAEFEPKTTVERETVNAADQRQASTTCSSEPPFLSPAAPEYPAAR